MNKKLAVLAAVLVFGAVGLVLSQSVKAQDAMANSDSGTTMNADATAPAAPAAQ